MGCKPNFDHYMIALLYSSRNISPNPPPPLSPSRKAESLLMIYMVDPDKSG
jgi:hypothetical protein